MEITTVHFGSHSNPSICKLAVPYHRGVRQLGGIRWPVSVKAPCVKIGATRKELIVTRQHNYGASVGMYSRLGSSQEAETLVTVS